MITYISENNNESNIVYYIDSLAKFAKSNPRELYQFNSYQTSSCGVACVLTDKETLTQDGFLKSSIYTDDNDSISELI